MFAGNQPIKKAYSSKVSMTIFANTQGLDYELIDSGEGRKLERFGPYLLDRPEVEAQGAKKLSGPWAEAHYTFEQKSASDGVWHYDQALPNSWLIEYHWASKVIKFQLQLSKFKHIGLFPEQVENWKFIQHHLLKNKSSRILNLFAYTSAASIVASESGAEVTNVEALKQLSHWAKQNADLNGIDNVRWLVEDARAYVKRALRREERFHGIILDPPAFGHGSKGKRWILEKHLENLIKDVSNLLVDGTSFVIINTYSPKMPLESLKDILERSFSGKYKLSIDDLSLKAQSGNTFKTGVLARIFEP